MRSIVRHPPKHDTPSNVTHCSKPIDLQRTFDRIALDKLHEGTQGPHRHWEIDCRTRPLLTNAVGWQVLFCIEPPNTYAKERNS
jgi:hypothetical protein